MRVRTMSPTGDMTFGRGQANFLIDTPAAVAQAIATRLGLWVGQWFLDQTVGTPWLTNVVGEHTLPYYDAAIRDRILGTPGILNIQTYNSNLNTVTRTLTVNAVVNTIYGPATLNGVGIAPPVPPG